MNVWQASAAAMLTVATVLSIVGSRRALRLLRQIDDHFLTPWQRLFKRYGWALPVFPLSETWILWMGGFWS